MECIVRILRTLIQIYEMLKKAQNYIYNNGYYSYFIWYKIGGIIPGVWHLTGWELEFEDTGI